MTDTPIAAQIEALAKKALAEMQRVARQDGWALAVHGSMSRDLDLIAVPWTDKASYTPAFVEAMRAAFSRALDGPAYIAKGDDDAPKGQCLKPNGRLAYVIHGGMEQLVVRDNGAFPYIDLSVMDFRMADMAQAFSDGVYVACNSVANTDRMADSIIESAWPDWADIYARRSSTPAIVAALGQGEGASDADKFLAAEAAAEAWTIPCSRDPADPEQCKPKDDCIYGYREGYYAALRATSPAHDERDDEVMKLREALIMFQAFGCPLCFGDCSAANPPVFTCPMQITSAALSPAKGGKDAVSS